MQDLPKPENLDPYVKAIFLIEDDNESAEHQLPFYAEGFPGIVYSESRNAFFLQPRNKELSEFYLFSQAIAPITLSVKGSYSLIAFIL